jgi:preprotein translocase subunit SecA
MGVNYRENLIAYFRENQSLILDPVNGLSNQIKPLSSRRTPKSDIFHDVLIEIEGRLYVVKHIMPAPMDHLLPLDFSESFVLKYNGTKDTFLKESLVLTEEQIDKNFDYTLSSPDNINRIAFAIMTSFPFIEEFCTKIKISFMKVGRNESCPCGSGKKYKKCCGQ